MLLRPLDGVGIGALAGQEQGAEFRQVVFGDELAVRVFLLDGAEGGRRGEQGRDLVLGDHPPEGAGIGRADRLALVEDRGAAGEQRRVDDIGMADDPADIGGGPIHLARLDAVDSVHRPVQRDHVAAIVAHDALGLAGRARGIEDIERIGGGNRHAIGLGAGLFGCSDLGGIVEVAAGDQGRSAAGRAAGSTCGRPCGRPVRSPCRAAACRQRRGPARCRRRPRRSVSAWRRRCGWRVRWRQSRRRRPNGWRRGGRRRAWRSPLPAPSAYR